MEGPETYLSTSDAWLRDLTRQRRSEARAGTLPAYIFDLVAPIITDGVVVPWPEVTEWFVRFHAEQSTEFAVRIKGHGTGAGTTRRRASYRSWHTLQWQKGVRTCYYCDVKMTLPRNRGSGIFVCTPITATVDHKHPLALGGPDHSSNWVMCCSACNNKKGAMTEAEFRALMAREASLAIAAE